MGAIGVGIDQTLCPRGRAAVAIIKIRMSHLPFSARQLVRRMKQTVLKRNCGEAPRMGNFPKIVPILGIYFLDKPSFRYGLLAMPVKYQSRMQAASLEKFKDRDSQVSLRDMLQTISRAIAMRPEWATF
jgi:hypothetical protein